MRLVVVSPHLDDAVLSCGDLLAAHPGARVVTVFAGAPADASRAGEWDARCGFASAAEAVAARRREDRRALARLGAEPCWLDLPDAQYGASPPRDAIAAALAETLARGSGASVLLPLGLFHSDHRLAHDAARAALAARGEWLAYEDVPYRRLDGFVQRRLGELAAEGLVATPAGLDVPAAPAKAAALADYASQWATLADDARRDASRPERVWRLRPRRDGDER